MDVIPEFDMADIVCQLQRAQELEYLSLLIQSNSVVTAVFYPHIKSSTVSIVVRHINLKYGKYVMAWRDTADPHKIEIWHKQIAL